MRLTLTLILPVLFSLLQLSAFAQFQGFFDEQGRLQVDSTFRIGEKQQTLLERFQQPVLVQIGSKLNYPTTWQRSGLGGFTVIFSFTLGKDQLVQAVEVVRVLDKSGQDITNAGLVETVREKLVNNFRLALYEAYNLEALAPAGKGSFTYYFPVKYQLSTEMEKRGLGKDSWLLQELQVRVFTDIHCPGAAEK